MDRGVLADCQDKLIELFYRASRDINENALTPGDFASTTANTAEVLFADLVTQ